MPIYTVHEPPTTRPEARRGPERFVFVRDGFYFWAFLLTPLWLLWRRLWLVFFGYIVVSAALAFGMRWLGVSNSAVVVMQFLLSFLIGLEAGSLWRWTLRRRKWSEAGVVSADDRETAERRYFDVWTQGTDLREATGLLPASAAFGRPAMHAHASSASGIVGLFPEPGAQR